MQSVRNNQSMTELCGDLAIDGQRQRDPAATCGTN